jgi:hypothetical protein
MRVRVLFLTKERKHGPLSQHKPSPNGHSTLVCWWMLLISTQSPATQYPILSLDMSFFLLTSCCSSSAAPAQLQPLPAPPARPAGLLHAKTYLIMGYCGPISTKYRICIRRLSATLVMYPYFCSRQSQRPPGPNLVQIVINCWSSSNGDAHGSAEQNLPARRLQTQSHFHSVLATWERAREKRSRPSLLVTCRRRRSLPLPLPSRPSPALDGKVPPPAPSLALVAASFARVAPSPPRWGK